MKTKITEEMIAAYLYGELSEEEKKLFETQLKQDPKLALEIKNLMETKTLLGGVKDVEVVASSNFQGRNVSSGWMTFRVVSNTILKPAIALAASISLAILLGYLTDLNVVGSKGSFSINFGQPAQSDPVLTSEDIAQVVTNYLERDRKAFDSRVDDLEKNFNVKLTSIMEEQRSDPQNSSTKDRSSDEEIMNQFIQRLQRENRVFLAEYGEISNLNQQQYMNAMMEQFANFWKDQREEDLRRIQYNLTLMQESQQQQRLDTDQVLASIINTVNNQND